MKPFLDGSSPFPWPFQRVLSLSVQALAAVLLPCACGVSALCGQRLTESLVPMALLPASASNCSLKGLKSSMSFAKHTRASYL